MQCTGEPLTGKGERGATGRPARSAPTRSPSAARSQAAPAAATPRGRPSASVSRPATRTGAIEEGLATDVAASAPERGLTHPRSTLSPPVPRGGHTPGRPPGSARRTAARARRGRGAGRRPGLRSAPASRLSGRPRREATLQTAGPAPWPVSAPDRVLRRPLRALARDGQPVLAAQPGRHLGDAHPPGCGPERWGAPRSSGEFISISASRGSQQLLRSRSGAARPRPRSAGRSASARAARTARGPARHWPPGWRPGCEGAPAMGRPDAPSSRIGAALARASMARTCQEPPPAVEVRPARLAEFAQVEDGIQPAPIPTLAWRG